MWTVLPLTSRHKDDGYYFHYDLKDTTLGVCRIENLINISVNRIMEPYYKKDRIATISKQDNDNIIKIIKKYYAFENEKVTILSKNVNKKKREKVLT